MQLITGKTKLLGVIGHPVEHSLSPVMHNAALASLSLDYVYIPLPVKSEDLANAITGLDAIHLLGFNVTIPHKQTILPMLSEVSPVAQMVGAANTIYRTEAGWGGTNTDVDGFIASLKALQRNWQQVSPVIIGNGGAARGVVAGCAELGCREIHIIGRNREKLAQFQQSWQNTPLQATLNTHQWEELPALMPSTQLLVNTTPIGMSPNVEKSPVDPAAMEKLQPGAIAYDLIYRPSPTQFLEQAKSQGAIALDGLEMLIQQGAAALEMWLQQQVPVDVMRQSLLEQLGRD